MLQIHKQLKNLSFLFFFLMAASWLPILSPLSEARKPVRWRAKKMIVVDPGHGGPESGVRGPSGVLEKTVTLELARRIETALKNRFRVRLTRTDDYGLELIRRTDVANHLDADVFISLHTGGSFQHAAHGMTLFYFRETRSNAVPGSTASEVSWDRLQLSHVKESKLLAESLKKQFDEAAPGTRCRIDTAPLLVLRGADMPAVLIEVGTLTNPDDEKKLETDDDLDLLSRAIAEGVDEFLRRRDAGSDR